jgi:hypothetical protein
MPARPRILPPGLAGPCLPTVAPQPPSGAAWMREIKHDGSVIARKIDERAGNDLTDRFPLIGPRGVSQGLSFWARLLGFAKEWAPRVGTGAPVCGECAVQACADLNADQARAQFLKKRILEKYAAPLT